jgi:hypothetical protein
MSSRDRFLKRDIYEEVVFENASRMHIDHDLSAFPTERRATRDVCRCDRTYIYLVLRVTHAR